MNINNIEKKLQKIGYKNPRIISENLGCPTSYCIFVEKYSGQELSSLLQLYSFPVEYNRIFGQNIKELDGMLIFGSDIGEYTYAFDTKNNWEVVDIDASGEIFERYGDFETFINKILDEIIESMENDE